MQLKVNEGVCMACLSLFDHCDETVMISSLKHVCCLYLCLPMFIMG